jgi:hypothetical protein
MALIAERRIHPSPVVGREGNQSIAERIPKEASGIGLSEKARFMDQTISSLDRSDMELADVGSKRWRADLLECTSRCPVGRKVWRRRCI